MEAHITSDIYDISIEESEKFLTEEGCALILEYGLEDEFKPQWDDLARLYLLVRQRKPFQIVEFGSGFSTLTMAYALRKNWEECLALQANRSALPQDSGAYRPQLVALETSEKWRDNSLEKAIKSGLSDFVEINFSDVYIAEYEGQVCHFYEQLPDVVPDFVYLDGPDPSTVRGNVNGISFQNLKRTVMAADILKYESTLLPGFFMIVDGRSNNARFLQRMLRRKYHYSYYPTADVSTFELAEPRLGKKNIFGAEFYGQKEDAVSS